MTSPLTVRASAALLLTTLLGSCTATAGPGVPPAAGSTGGTVRVGITTPAGVDPGNAYEPSSELIARTLCDPLLSADPRTGELRPSLVASWVVSDSGQRVVLRLRKGLRFTDGSTVTAEDVAFSLSRVASADFAGAAADRLSLIDGYAEVHGDTETDNDTDRRRLRGLRVLDQQSLEITLTERRADFLRLLTTPLVTPVPRALATKDPVAFARQPVCSGPYRLASPYAPGDPDITLKRVAGRAGVDAGLTAGGAGYAATIVFQVSTDPAAAQRAGTVDVAPATATDQTHVVSGPGSLVEYVGLPTTTAPFDRPDVRRALALALDREALVRQVFPGTHTVATGFLPPTDRPVFTKAACDLPARGDLPAARRLLTRAGVDLTGAAAPYLVNSDGRNVALARAVAAQWQAGLGFRTRLVPLPYAQYLAQVGTTTGPFRFSYATPYADPDGLLSRLFSTDAIGRDNASRYSSPTFDRALGRLAREAEDPADRVLEYRRAEQVLCADLPMIPLAFSTSRWLITPSVQGAALDAATGLPLLRELRPA